MTLSIIVPVYKVEKYLRRCVDSILNQTFSDFELILVDDGSPDNCGAICDEYAAKDDRIAVIHKANGGLSSARNAGLDIAQGDYIGFVDSDDHIHPRMYEILVETMEREKTDLVQCWYQRVRSDESTTYLPIETLPRTQKYEKSYFLGHYNTFFWKKVPGYVWLKLYRKRIFEKLRFPEGVLIEDLHILLPTLQQCDSIALIDIPLYYYVQNPESIMQKGMTLQHVRDHMEAYYNHLRFFSNEKNWVQYRLTQETICCVFAFYYFNHYFIKKIEGFEKEKRKIILKQYPAVLCSSHTCRMKKACLLSLLINKKLAIRLFFKYYPECVPARLWSRLKRKD